MNQPENAIVVAVGYRGCETALKFAVAEAERTGCPLHLVQVSSLPDTGEYAGIYAPNTSGEDAAFAQVLQDARDLAAEAGVAVTGERVEDRSHVACLVRHADHGRSIVLQHRRIGALHRVVTGSTTNGVAARAAVPVLSVPEDWSSESAGSPVTVAVQDASEATGLLRAGFAEARARHTDLVLLHAWWLASGFDVSVVDETIKNDWTRRFESSIEPVLQEVCAEFPEVSATVQVRHAPPAEAIVDATQRSDLLVIGRRHHRLPLGTHLGPVARAALNHSACPVMVVAPTHR